MPRYLVTKRRCFLYGKTHAGDDWDTIKCSTGSVVMWPDWMWNGNNQPLCERHARHYYGDVEVNRLINLGIISKWKVSTGLVTQGAMMGNTKESNNQ